MNLSKESTNTTQNLHLSLIRINMKRTIFKLANYSNHLFMEVLMDHPIFLLSLRVACLQALLPTRFQHYRLLFVLAMGLSWVQVITCLQRQRQISLLPNKKERSTRQIIFSRRKNNKLLIFIKLNNTHKQTANELQSCIQPTKKRLWIL